MARILTHKPDPGNRIGLHYSRFRRYFAFLSPRNQLLAPNPGGQNRYYRPPIREVGLNSSHNGGGSSGAAFARRFLYTPRSRNGDDVTDTSLCCAPIINLWGAYWPAWVLCLVSGILLTLVSRLILSWTRLEPHLGPLLLVYPMLIVAYACGLWLLLYRA